MKNRSYYDAGFRERNLEREMERKRKEYVYIWNAAYFELLV